MWSSAAAYLEPIIDHAKGRERALAVTQRCERPELPHVSFDSF
jgi:hypothetical protein